MTEPLSDQRLAEIRAGYPFGDDRPWLEDDAVEAFDAVLELVDEVERLRAELAELGEPRVEWTLRGNPNALPDEAAARFTARFQPSVIVNRRIYRTPWRPADGRETPGVALAAGSPVLVNDCAPAAVSLSDVSTATAPSHGRVNDAHAPELRSSRNTAT